MTAGCIVHAAERGIGMGGIVGFAPEPTDTVIDAGSHSYGSSESLTCRVGSDGSWQEDHRHRAATASWASHN